MASGQPWSNLSPGLAAVLRPMLGSPTDRTIAEIGSQVAAYSGPVQEQVAPVVRRGVEIALSRLLDLFGTQSPALDGRSQSFYRRIGAGESREGRSLEALLAAYRIGARVAWEEMAATAMAAGVANAELVILAESIFVYIDELSAASADGHASEGAFRDVKRSRLAQALIDGLAASDPVALSHLADAARWALPHRLAVAVVPAGDRLPPPPADALVVESGEDVIVILPDPSGPGRREQLSAAWRGRQVFVGTVRPPEEAPISLAHAIRIRRLAAHGVVAETPILAAADHLAEMVVAADEPLLAELRHRVLAPLAELSEGKAQTLQSTLRMWLACQGDRAQISERLFVHPQTVSYRMARLHELFDGQLDQPSVRFNLQLALGLP